MVGLRMVRALPAVALLFLSASACEAGSTYAGKPKSLSYDAKGDRVLRADSVYTDPRTSTGGPRAYYGNRLRKFRYTGAPGTGGIYDLMEYDRVEQKRDPAKYRYRW
jgi:hypothetical protein